MKSYVWIGAGGFIGAVIRYLAKGLPFGGAAIPMPTLLVNAAGAFILAFVATFALEVYEYNSYLTRGLSVGLLGALTTFSTMSREISGLLLAGDMAAAVIYMVLSVLVGLSCAWAGTAAARAAGRVRQRQLETADTTQTEGDGD